MTTHRESCLAYAQVCERAERFEEMATAMKDLVDQCPSEDLTVEERELLDIALKNAVGPKRASWRIILTEEEKQVSVGNDRLAALAHTERTLVEREVVEVCSDAIRIARQLLVNAAHTESRITYLKSIGDYSRYLAEVYVARGSQDRELLVQTIREGRAAYEDAVKLMDTPLTGDRLPSNHPLRLGLALNFSIFIFEVLCKPKEACIVARNAFEQAAVGLETASEASTKLMQLLRNNLVRWTSTGYLNVLSCV